ncbi:FMN-binding negative transcriptional regulator [Aquibaculum arenosum]|uniref:FMN-binding negative transcriptional regulator n=1 Tax=Aquibaculum arenosum TaxID=3032591 RepID=A0ABT5YMF5_9PROT|nr:FMN-binding negative transcriptional regulator [Fodinicurvata sp. CAU 1616]MDF2096011.1 FMN-binding negative transcriptional regulator [Fodinicurvata sp. CAU 1616]
MHIVRPAFRMEEQAALAFAAERGFGLVVTAGPDGPVGSHVPFVLREEAHGVVAQMHFTAQNPLIALADGRRRFLLAVTGGDSYVSNDWYVSADQVSTWLYEAVHLSGVASQRPLTDNRNHGDDLLAVAEARLPKAPWSLSSMEPGKRETMLNGIRVVEIAVDRIEGQSKLNHHKPDADHVAVANHLAKQPSTAARELAAKMRALRPHLDYAAPKGEAAVGEREPGKAAG